MEDLEGPRHDVFPWWDDPGQDWDTPRVLYPDDPGHGHHDPPGLGHVHTFAVPSRVKASPSRARLRPGPWDVRVIDHVHVPELLRVRDDDLGQRCSVNFAAGETVVHAAVAQGPRYGNMCCAAAVTGCCEEPVADGEESPTSSGEHVLEHVPAERINFW